MKTELLKMAPTGTATINVIDAEHRIDRRQQRVAHRLRHVDHGEGERGDQVGREMTALGLQALRRGPEAVPCVSSWSSSLGREPDHRIVARRSAAEPPARDTRDRAHAAAGRARRRAASAMITASAGWKVSNSMN